MPTQYILQPGRHVGDPREKMRIPRKSNLPCSPQDPAVRSIMPHSLPSDPVNFAIHSNSPRQPAQQGMLPPGIVLPPGIDPSILLTSDHALTLLKQLSPAQQQAALLEFEEAMRNKGNRVRNSQAYLVGVIKRYITVTRKEKGVGAPIMGHTLTHVVQVSFGVAYYYFFSFRVFFDVVVCFVYWSVTSFRFNFLSMVRALFSIT